MEKVLSWEPLSAMPPSDNGEMAGLHLKFPLSLDENVWLDLDPEAAEHSNTVGDKQTGKAGMEIKAEAQLNRRTPCYFVSYGCAGRRNL